MNYYKDLSAELQRQIQDDRNANQRNPFACTNESVIRRNMERDKNKMLRPSYVRDIDKIIHSPFYNRYTDKTQVFSLYKNDDISRRALHVQLVSRIARNIGSLLNLNLDLIEAIALGHDIGHTPFGHAGERILNKLYLGNTGRLFNHNIHSVRVLDTICKMNISLQVLDGIICHNGEMEQKEYRPRGLKDLKDYDERVENCYIDKKNIDLLIPATLEGCVVRLCDMIAYIGKDRQDAVKAKIIDNTDMFTPGIIGSDNGHIINNMVVDIVENSYGKNYIYLSKEVYDDLIKAKSENYKFIYKNQHVDQIYNETISPMIERVYIKLLQDLTEKNMDSIIFKHHINYIEQIRRFYAGEKTYFEEEPNQIVVDYIASMTDDYFVDLYHHLFEDNKYKVKYKSYFD